MKDSIENGSRACVVPPKAGCPWPDQRPKKEKPRPMPRLFDNNTGVPNPDENRDVLGLIKEPKKKSPD
jgi:hypothetical protein